MVELSYEELDSYVQQICTGEKLVYVKDRLEEEIPLLFRYPTSRSRRLANHAYKQALAEAERLELPSIAEMEVMARERGLFNDADEEKVRVLRGKLAGQRAVLAKTTKIPARRDRLEANISRLKDEIAVLEFKKEATLEMTQERKASEEKFLFLTRWGVLDPTTEELYWGTEEEFENEPDFVFRKRVLLEYIVFAHGIEQTPIRAIARSNLWRLRYITATKMGEGLFGRSISSYSVDQLTVLYWSHFYQSVYEMMPDERPSDNIIEDDEALDAYMMDWHADRNRDAVASREKKGKSYGQNSAWDHDETLVMRSNPIHKDVEYSETAADKAKHSGQTTVDAASAPHSKR